MMNPYLLCAMYLFRQDDGSLFMLMVRTSDDFLKKKINRFLSAKKNGTVRLKKETAIYLIDLINYITYAYHLHPTHLIVNEVQKQE